MAGNGYNLGSTVVVGFGVGCLDISAYSIRGQCKSGTMRTLKTLRKNPKPEQAPNPWHLCGTESSGSHARHVVPQAASALGAASIRQSAAK